MALKSTIFKIELQISDLDRGQYATHSLTLARHPSETDERMMLRVLAFALFAGERLVFCKGLSDPEEPDLWEIDLTGIIQLWIEIGLPDPRRLQKACGRARRVVVIAYGSNARAWWGTVRAALPRTSHLSGLLIERDECAALAKLVTRTLRLDCTIQEGLVWIGTGSQSVAVSPVNLDANA